MKWPNVTEDDGGIRPAGEPDTCFYCGRKIGQEHTHDCVTIVKKIRIRYSFEIEIYVPHSWDVDMINFHRNGSSWCASNALDEIKEYTKNGCACECCKAEFVEDVDTTPTKAKD